MPVQSPERAVDVAGFVTNRSWLEQSTLGQQVTGEVQRRQRPAFAELGILCKAGQLPQVDPVDPNRLGLIALQPLLIEIGGQNHLNFLAHVAGGQRQLGQQLQLPGTETGFLLEFTIGSRQHVFARLDQALGQGQLVGIGTTAVFFDQHRVVGIEHGHDHHRTGAGPPAGQTLVGPLDAIGKAQLQLFNAEQTTAGDDCTGKYGRFLTHDRLLYMNEVLYRAFPDVCVGYAYPLPTPDEARMLSMPWSEIDTVLLDMDGTLLDLHYDEHFWMQHLPQRYAELHGISFAMAWLELKPLFENNAGTLNWYCLDFWSAELKLSVRDLKREIAHMIALRPDAETFLAAIKKAGKRVIMITN
ncbi:Haloacid dehalogenase, partial [Pseudomonas caricapapayae]